MKQTIWKYQLEMTAEDQVYQIPRGAEVLCVQMQHDIPTLWVRVFPGKKEEERKFQIVGTGHKVDKYNKYIGTVQKDGGVFMWHIFEVIK